MRAVFGLLLFCLPARAADPWEDPASQAVADAIRADPKAWQAFLGVGFDSPTTVAAKEGPTPDAVRELLAPELARAGWSPVWTFRPSATVAVGTLEPDEHSGDTEPGVFSARVRPAVAGYAGPFALRFAPDLGLDDLTPSVRWRVWGGVSTAHYTLGFGKQDRWIGPGRHGNLLLDSQAEPPWLGSGSIEGKLPAELAILGRFRAEIGAGWMDLPRTDVQDPGLLLMDFRWSPVPYGEIGLTRLSMFGGEGRPAVDFGQLLVPSEPHVYDDPDLTQPDQNEQASIDLRVTLPIGKWTKGPLRYVEGWWEYGGEDMIVRHLGTVPYPALAGVANLYGGEVGIGPVTATGEVAVLMDDYFRWYVGHRVYHAGFTQDGEVLGYPSGGDARTIYGALRWDADRWRARAWGEQVRRVCVLEVVNDHVFALPTEEHRLQFGADGGLPLRHGGHVGLGVAYAHVTGVNFVDGETADEFRVYASLDPAATATGTKAGVHW